MVDDEADLDREQSYNKSNAGRDENEVPTLSDGRSDHRTDFNPNDVPSHERERVWRDGEWVGKYERLKQLQGGKYNRDTTKLQDANIRRDVDVLTSTFDLPDTVRGKTLEILMGVREQHGGGLSGKFGDVTVEVAEVAALRLACESLTNVDEWDDLDVESNPIHAVARQQIPDFATSEGGEANDGIDDWDGFLEWFLPSPEGERREYDRSDVRKARTKLRDLTDP